MPTYLGQVTSNQIRRASYVYTPSGATTNAGTSGTDVVADLIQVRNANINWRVQVAKGLEAGTPYRKMGVQDFRLELAKVRAENKSLQYRSEAVVRRLGGITLSPNDTALKDLALTRLKKKLRNNAAIANAAVPLGELRDFRKTIRGIAEASAGVLQTLRSIRKGNFGAATRYRQASKAWLTYSFGVSPMLKDAEDIAKALAEYQHGRDRFVKLVGKAEKTWMSTATGYVGPGAYGADVHKAYALKHSLSYLYTAGFQINVKSANPYGVLEQLSLTDPGMLPVVAWELTAFSWVADYFANIGDFIEDRFVAPAGTARYISLNRKYTVEVTGVNFFKPVSGFSILEQRPGMVRYKYFDFERTIPSSLPHIGLNFKTSDQITSHAISKLLNLTAILGRR